jgi:hypothetical protein
VSRVDVPTLKCDRCGYTTQDTKEMISYKKLSRSHMSGENSWDLCPACYLAFMKFIAGGAE